ncbi:MAG: preprotein translocase subunit SecY [bacterium]
MIDTLKRIWNIPELRKSVLFVVGVLAFFRVIAHIPIPGVDATVLRQFFEQNQVLGLLNIFSGGTIAQFSVVALGVAPYITASIIFQLLGMIFPALDELQKEGEFGKQKINRWTRWLTIPLSLLQSYGLIALLKSSGPLAARGEVLSTPLEMVLAMTTMTAGTVFLMWLGELISEKKIGNGMSLIIFAGIIASMPVSLTQFLVTFDRSQLFTAILFVAIALLMVVGVVMINEAQRNIPIAHARQATQYSSVPGFSNHLPLRVNMAGVIPIIFAISVMLFPPMIARFFFNVRSIWLSDIAHWVVSIFNNQIFYSVAYFLLVFFFTFFYTSIVFQPEKIAENLQKQSAFIPGIRPGKPTAEYISQVTSRILLAGGLFLAVIAVLPHVLQQYSNSTQIAVGGTSFLIVVSVIIETVKQVESQLKTAEYDSYSKV